ncbi:hypothetical protein LCGC14_2581920 [marine sediment metagenome]|uniref:Uncharacterized protein n=1 Tax=marine sediment metagenome TaxID=412755 RepID=A0A0F9CQB0_9ZZZZ
MKKKDFHLGDPIYLNGRWIGIYTMELEGEYLGIYDYVIGINKFNIETEKFEGCINYEKENR